jgi:ketosteroid isomerase-like protein
VAGNRARHPGAANALFGGMGNAEKKFAHEPETVQAYLDKYAKALTSGDGKTIATMWEVPALVLADDMSKGVYVPAEVEAFFAGAKDEYNKRGIVDTKAVIEREEWLTDRMVSVDVRWPYIDGRGQTTGSESSTYVLRRGDDGALKMRVALMRGEAKSR